MEHWKSHWPITMEERDKRAKVRHERASERDESAARSLPQSSLNHLVHKMPSSHCQTPVFVYNVMTRQCRLLREGAAAMSYQHMKANVHKL